MTIEQVKARRAEIVQEIAQKAIQRNFMTKCITDDQIMVNLPDGEVIYWVCYDHVMDLFYIDHIWIHE